jgi:CheY-like chemotaxis protein
MTLIAVVDDRATNRQIFAKLAATIEPGIRVRTFGDPVAALDWLDANPPDLVVADYQMPQMTGAEFTRALRQRDYGEAVPLIMVTAYEDREDRLRALEAGATDFLQTPVDHQEFISRARNLLHLRRHDQIATARVHALEQALANDRAQRSEGPRNRGQTGQARRRDDRPDPGPLFDMLPLLISVTDRSGEVIYNSERLAGGDPRRHRELDRQIIESGKPLPSFEEHIVDSDGHARLLLTTKAPLRDAAGQTVRILTTSIDLSDRSAGETMKLQYRIAEEIVAGTPSFAVHVIGLDRQHHDETQQAAMLQSATARLRPLARPEDLLAWRGGNEIVLLQTREPDEMAAAALADRLRRALTEDPAITAHIGISLYPAHGHTPAALLDAARCAVEAATPGSVALIYQPSMNRRL